MAARPSPRPAPLHSDLLLLDQPGGTVVRRTAAALPGPRRLLLPRRAHHRAGRLDQNLEQQRPALQVDQDRRSDHRPHLPLLLTHLRTGTLADVAGARTLMQETDEILRRRPRLGTLVDEARELRARLSKERQTNTPVASALTAAELRLLPLLTTHLSFPEIAAEMFVSRNTVKSQVLSIYRKLDSSSRNQAVTRARELGLLEG